MKINPHMFRGYDLRGIVGEDLTPEIVVHIGKAHGTYMRRRGVAEAVVGYDCRATSQEYARALIQGFVAAGIDVINIGMNLVGTFYWSQYHLGLKGGAYVTASHNPAEYNGFKFAIDFSETLVSDGMLELKRMVEEDDYDTNVTEGKVVELDLRNEYFDDILKRLPLKHGLKVVVDPSCSTAGEIAPILLRKAGCDVIEKNCAIDPSFPLGTPDPTESLVANRLSREVLEAGADIGFSFDADGDRIGIVDDKGTVIWNDVLVALFAIDVLSSHPGAKIMYNTLCSKTVPETITRYGGKPFMWRTGHSFLKKKNQEVGAAFIGELSGHFFFSADFYNHDDGLYSMMRLLSYLARTGQKLSEAVAELPAYSSSPEIKLYCADDRKVGLMERLAPKLRSDFPGAAVVDDERAGDGIRLDLADGMFVIRYSQNGPYLTIKYEAKKDDLYRQLRHYLATTLKQFPEIDWSSKINVNIEALA